MPYYSLPKIKPPTPQVPTRAVNNRQRFSDTLQQRQQAIDGRKQEIQSGYVLNKLLAEPPPAPMLPPPVGRMMPPVGAFGMNRRQRLPGFAEGGDVYTDGGETEDERREREAREAAGAAAGQFMGRGYMGGLGNFAPPPALPGAPVYGPTQPTYAENVQAMVKQNPEAVQIAAGEAQANNADANLAQLRDYLPGGEKGPWYGPTVSPAQAQAGVQKELGPGMGGAVTGAAGDALSWAYRQPETAGLLQAVAPAALLFNTGNTPWAEPASAVNEAVGNAGAWLGRQQDRLPEPLQQAINPTAPLLNRVGISGEDIGHELGSNLLPETWSQSAMTALGAIGAKGPLEAVFNIPGIDEALRGRFGPALERAGAGVAERLPGIRASVMEGLRNGELGAARIPGELPPSRSGSSPVNDQASLERMMRETLANRAADRTPANLRAAATSEENLLQYLNDQPMLAQQAEQRSAQLAAQMRGAVDEANALRAGQPLPEGMQGALRGIAGPPSFQGQGQFPGLPSARELPPLPAQNLLPGQAPLPELRPGGAVQADLPEALYQRGLPNFQPPPAGVQTAMPGMPEPPAGLLPGIREPVAGPPPAGALPGQAPLLETRPAPPTTPGLPGVGALGRGEQISQWMREAQALVEPKPLPLESRTPPAPPAREPLPSEKLATGFTPPAERPLPNTGRLALNDPEKFAIAQRWMGDQTNPPANSLSPQEMSNRLYHAGLESIQSNRPDGTFSPAQLRNLTERYNYADSRGIKLPGEEPPSGMPDTGDLMRGSNVRQLSLDEAEAQAARLGVPFDRELIEKGYKATADAEWNRLQQATDDFLEKERIANSPEGKAAEADYKERLKQEQENPDPKAPPTPPPGGFPKEVNTSDLQRAYNTVAYAAYWSLGGDIGQFLRQNVMTFLNLFNVPQSLEVVRLLKDSLTTGGAARTLDSVDAEVKAAIERAGLSNAKLKINLPEVPGHRAGDAASRMASREIVQSPALNKIPFGIGKGYEVTSTLNAMTPYLVRSLEAVRFLDNLPDRRFVIGFGNQRNSPAAKAAIAQSYFNQVAVMGGRASLGPWEDLLSKAGPLFTSLRFMMSIPERVPYLLPVNRIAAGHWEIMGPQWREAVRQHAGYFGALGGALAAAGAAGAEVNPPDRYGNPQYGSFRTPGGLTIDLTGGQSKYWGAVRDAVNGDWNRAADFARNKTGPIPEDLFMAIQATGLDKATGTEEFFNYMRPQFFDQGFTGQAKREAPGLNWNTADRLASLVAPLFLSSTVKSYINSQKTGASPFESAALAAGTGVSEFFGASARLSNPGVLTQLRTNAKGDESLDPTIRDVDFKDLGPRGKADVDKVAEASSPEEYKEARKEADERNPVWAQHREQSQKITDESNQRKTDLYERFRTGQIDGKQMMDGRKAANSAAQAKREEAQNDKAYKKAIEELPEQNDVNKALKIYNAMYDQNRGPDGKIDFEAVRAKQDEFIRYVGAHDRPTANLLLYEVRPAEKGNPLDRLIEVAQPTLSHYFGDLKGDTVQKQNELRANPRDDALINLLGYAQKTLTPEAAGILQQMKASLPSGRDFVAAAPAAAGAVQRSSAPAPAPAPPPQQMAAPIGAPKDYSFPVQGYGGKVDLHWGSDKGAADLFAERGTPVLAMRGGTVTSVGTSGLGGNNVTIHGTDGKDYYYAHGDGAPQVKVGQNIPTGQFLFGVGDSGNAAGKGTHLHLGIGNGIISGSGATGGSGRDFDATALLQSVLGERAAGGGRGMSAPVPAAANTGGTDRASLQGYAADVAQRNGLDPAIFKGLIGHESSWDPKAVNKTSGAAGLGQMLPSTARGYGTTPERLLSDPRHALDTSARMLGDLAQSYNGDQQKALAAYFVGAGNVKEAVDAAGSGWLSYLDRRAEEKYHQGTVSAYLRGVGAL